MVQVQDAMPVVHVAYREIMTFEEVVLQPQKEDILMDIGPFDWEELIAAGEPPVNVNCHGRVREGEAPVDAYPSLVNYWPD